jgi:hypothetical protein
MPDTFVKIATNTVGSGGIASVTFSSIPSTYTDLLIKISARSNSTAGGGIYDEIKMDINGANTGQTTRRLIGEGGGTPASDTLSNNAAIFGGAMSATNSTANTFGSGEFYIPNYTSSTLKSVSNDGVSENNATGQYSAIAVLAAGINASTSAVTSLVFTLRNGTLFTQYSTFTLYGISKS